MRMEAVPVGNSAADATAQLVLDLDSPLRGRVKNDRTVMVWSFFSLSKERVSELPIYDDGQVRIEISGSKHGVANIWDEEVLIYVASLLQDKINRGEPVSRRISFAANDFFRICGMADGGSSYDRIEGALARLQGTQIKTNIETGGECEGGFFSWLSDAKMRYRRLKGGERRLHGVEVELCDWLFRAIVRDRRMLTYDLEYFKLGPLERRLYEVARAHCGSQPGFRMGIDKLRQRTGSDMPLKTFKWRLAEMVKQNALPRYGMRIVDPKLRNGSTPKYTRLKSLQVFFYRLDDAALPFADAPVVEE